jgi:hypothetical protein
MCSWDCVVWREDTSEMQCEAKEGDMLRIRWTLSVVPILIPLANVQGDNLQGTVTGIVILEQDPPARRIRVGDPSCKFQAATRVVPNRLNLPGCQCKRKISLLQGPGCLVISAHKNGQVGCLIKNVAHPQIRMAPIKKRQPDAPEFSTTKRQLRGKGSRCR